MFLLGKYRLVTHLTYEGNILGHTVLCTVSELVGQWKQDTSFFIIIETFVFAFFKKGMYTL